MNGSGPLSVTWTRGNLLSRLKGIYEVPLILQISSFIHLQFSTFTVNAWSFLVWVKVNFYPIWLGCQAKLSSYANTLTKPRINWSSYPVLLTRITFPLSVFYILHNHPNFYFAQCTIKTLSCHQTKHLSFSQLHKVVISALYSLTTTHDQWSFIVVVLLFHKWVNVTRKNILFMDFHGNELTVNLCCLLFCVLSCLFYLPGLVLCLSPSWLRCSLSQDTLPQSLSSVASLPLVHSIPLSL